MASAGDFWARIVGSLYFIPLFLGVIAGFPYAVFAGGLAIVWLAYEAARMLTGELHTLRMALIWLILALPFFLAFVPLSNAAIALLWSILFGLSFFLNKQRELGFIGLLMLAASKGTKIKVTSNGEDSEELISALDNLIKSKFGEDS